MMRTSLRNGNDSTASWHEEEYDRYLRRGNVLPGLVVPTGTGILEATETTAEAMSYAQFNELVKTVLCQSLTVTTERLGEGCESLLQR